MTAPDRRDILKLITAGAAASLAGCRAPKETIHPMTEQPEGIEPGWLAAMRPHCPLPATCAASPGS